MCRTEPKLAAEGMKGRCWWSVPRKWTPTPITWRGGCSVAHKCTVTLSQREDLRKEHGNPRRCSPQISATSRNRWSDGTQLLWFVPHGFHWNHRRSEPSSAPPNRAVCSRITFLSGMSVQDSPAGSKQWQHKYWRLNAEPGGKNGRVLPNLDQVTDHTAAICC